MVEVGEGKEMTESFMKEAASIWTSEDWMKATKKIQYEQTHRNTKRGIRK